MQGKPLDAPGADVVIPSNATRRIATRDDRLARNFFSAVALVATKQISVPRIQRSCLWNGGCAIRTLAKLGTGVALWIGSAWIFGHIHFTPSMSNALGEVTDKFGIVGDEAIEDFYMELTMALALVLAIGVVWIVNRTITRRR